MKLPTPVKGGQEEEKAKDTAGQNEPRKKQRWRHGWMLLLGLLLVGMGGAAFIMSYFVAGAEKPEDAAIAQLKQQLRQLQTSANECQLEKQTLAAAEQECAMRSARARRLAPCPTPWPTMFELQPPVKKHFWKALFVRM